MKNSHTVLVLQQVLRVLENITESAFDLRSWRHPCGTTACVIGHCAQDKWFNEQGLTLHSLGYPTHPTGPSWQAVFATLGLPDSLDKMSFAEYLFSNAYYSVGSKVEVVARILLVINLLQSAKPITPDDLGCLPKSAQSEENRLVRYFNNYFTEVN